MYKCDDCDKPFKKKFNLTRHIENKHTKQFNCRFCRAKFKSEDEQLLHEKINHQNNCTICTYTTKSKKSLKNHYEKKHRPIIDKEPITGLKRNHEADEEKTKKKIKNNAEEAPPSVPPVRHQDHFKKIKFKQSYKPNSKDDLLTTQLKYKNHIKSELQEHLSKFGQLKFNIAFTIKFKKFKDNGEESRTWYFHSGAQIVLHEGDLEEKLNFSMQEIVRQVDKYLKNGSGWVYEETSKIDLYVYKYKPFRGGTYIPTPSPYNKKKNSLVNIKNDDDQCFLYCIQAARMYADGRVNSHY